MKKKVAKSYISDLPKTYIYFYQKPTKIFDIYKNRPLFFQRKKLINYNNKFNEYYEKINNLYIELNKEINLLEKLYEQF